jgi:hypothetical protein
MSRKDWSSRKLVFNLPNCCYCCFAHTLTFIDNVDPPDPPVCPASELEVSPVSVSRGCGACGTASGTNLTCTCRLLERAKHPEDLHCISHDEFEFTSNKLEERFCVAFSGQYNRAVTCSPATAFQSAPEPERPATYHEITWTAPLVHDPLAGRRLSTSPPRRRPRQMPTPLRETSLSETPSSSFDTYNLAPFGQDPSSLVQGMDAGFLEALQATEFAAIAASSGPVHDQILDSILCA